VGVNIFAIMNEKDVNGGSDATARAFSGAGLAGAMAMATRCEAPFL
jgi:hypothetical protein